MTNVKELKMPKFILGNEPTIANPFDYIYSPLYLSLVLVVEENSQITVLNDENLNRPQKLYVYDALEQYRFVLIQNNIEETGGLLAPEITPEQFLDEAWEWYRDYLVWEDKKMAEWN